MNTGAGHRSMVLLRSAVSGRPLHRHPAALATLVAAIALGVAMVVAVHLVNRSALEGFSDGVRALAGQADLTLKPAYGVLPEVWLQQLREMQEVRGAWPIMEIRLPIAAGKDDRVLTILGLDLLNDGGLRDLYRPGTEIGGADPMRVFERDAVILGAGVAADLGLSGGGRLAVSAGHDTLNLSVVALLPAGGPLDQGGVMDIATAQWTFARLGELDRIDLRLMPGVDRLHFRERIRSLFGERVTVANVAGSRERMEAMTRAYRVNLDVLSSVGLLTAGFMVWSLAGLSMRRRRSHFALLRTLGMGRPTLGALLLSEGVGFGVLGGLFGLALGVLLAWGGVALLGGDLGAGYFQQAALRLWWDSATLAGFVLLGVAVAVAAVLAPLWVNLRRLGGAGMVGGVADSGRTLGLGPRLAWIGLCLLAVAFAVLLPPWHGLPVAGYLALLFLLLASVLVMPLLIGLLARWLRPPSGQWVASMALAELRGASGRAVGGASAIMVSFALVVAMTTLVFAFRESLLAWLDRVLVADVYVSAGKGSHSVLDAVTIKRISEWPEVAAVARLRHTKIPYGNDAGGAPVHLQAGDLRHPMTRPDWPLLSGEWGSGNAFDRQVYVSEVFAGRFGVAVGDTIEVVFAPDARLQVAGVFRDYAHQWGQLLIDMETYRRLSGDQRVDGLALFGNKLGDILADRVRLQQRAAHEFIDKPGVEIRETGTVRAATLKIFDRSFAVTYVLVFVALLVGLFGVANAQAVQAPERRSQLAALGLLGMPRRAAARLLALEGGFIGLAGVVQGLLSGVLMAHVLIRVVNRQSFGWSIDTRFPWWPLLAVMVLLIGLSYGLSWMQGKRLATGDPVAALREE